MRNDQKALVNTSAFCIFVRQMGFYVRIFLIVFDRIINNESYLKIKIWQ